MSNQSAEGRSRIISSSSKTCTRKLGDKVEFQIRRDEKKDIEVTLAERTRRGVARRRCGARRAGRPAKTRPDGRMYAGQMENVQDEQGRNSYEYGGIYKSVDAGEIGSASTASIRGRCIQPDASILATTISLRRRRSMYRSSDGGKRFKPNAGATCMPISTRCGSIPVTAATCSWVAMAVLCQLRPGRTWDHLNNMAIGQFYHVAIRPKSRTRSSAACRTMARGAAQRSASTARPDQRRLDIGRRRRRLPMPRRWNDPNVIYSESQGGTISRRNTRTGEPRRSARRTRRRQRIVSTGIRRSFCRVGTRGSCIAAAITFSVRSIAAITRRSSPGDRGDPEGPGTAIAESPKNPDVLYAGTDNGAMRVTRDGVKKWSELAEVGLTGPRWVATIEASRYAEGRAYAVFDAHRSDDDEPLVYVTEDFGKTWKSLGAICPGYRPAACAKIVNPNLLYLGTEFGAGARSIAAIVEQARRQSADRGGS